MILSISNGKGGVGKTTTAVSLAGALGDVGSRVLLVDFDPRGDATLHAGLAPRNRDTIWPVMRQVAQRTPVETERRDFQALLKSLWNAPTGQARVPIVERPNDNPFDLVPSALDRGQAESQLISAVSDEHCLAVAIAGIQGYDFVLIDCPPTMGMLTINALTAADAVVVPVEAAFFAGRAMRQLFDEVLRIQQTLNHRLDVAGVLLTKVNRRSGNAKRIAAEARRALEGNVHVFGTEIPFNRALEEAPASGECVTRYARRSAGARAYRRLAQELLGMQRERDD
jgi:chromosome partitioning protein